jgi:hypothetical protein
MATNSNILRNLDEILRKEPVEVINVEPRVRRSVTKIVSPHPVIKEELSIKRNINRQHKTLGRMIDDLKVHVKTQPVKESVLVYVLLYSIVFLTSVGVFSTASALIDMYNEDMNYSNPNFTIQSILLVIHTLLLGFALYTEWNLIDSKVLFITSLVPIFVFVGYSIYARENLYKPVETYRHKN